MKKTVAVVYGILIIIISSFLLLSCEEDTGPADVQTPLLIEPASVAVTTGSTGLAAVSGGMTPYSIQTAPNPAVARATITTFGVLTITPVASGSTFVTVRDSDDPARTADVPITVTTGFGAVSVIWSINNQAPTYLCEQVASTLVRVTVDGYAPVTGPCGSGSITLDTVTAGNHFVTAELLNASNVVLSTITDSIFVAATYTTNVPAAFHAPLIIGALQAHWTINGQPAGAGCGSGVSVRAQLNSRLPSSEPCSRGQLTMLDIPAGNYTLVTDLLDDNNTSLSHGVMSVTIVANQITTVNLNFTTGPIAGNANINWTVNNGQNCPQNGQIKIEVTGPTTKTVNTNCSALTSHITGLGPGTYTFDITLTDPDFPGMQATAQAQNVTVTANSTTVVSRNIECLFCSGSDSTGWIQATVSCGGAACGLTGTLYVVIKDCGTNTAWQNTDTILGTTLSAGTPVSHTVTNVYAGGRCVMVFLDVDGNGQISTGDAISSIPETSTVVLGGQTATVNITLDTVSP